MGVGWAAWCTDSDPWTAHAVGCEQTMGSTYCGGRICQVCLKKYCTNPTIVICSKHFHSRVFYTFLQFCFYHALFFFLLDASYLFSWQNNIHKCRQILTAFTVCFSLITGCCYKFLENPASVKNGTTKDLVFNLLGVMVKKYNYGLGESTFFIGYYNVNNISIIVLSFYCLFPCPYKQGTCIYEWEIKIVHHKVSKLCWSL